MSTDRAPIKAKVDPQNLVVHWSFGSSTRWKVVEPGGSEMGLRSGRGRNKTDLFEMSERGCKEIAGWGMGMTEGTLPVPSFFPAPCLHLHQGLNWPLETVKGAGLRLWDVRQTFLLPEWEDGALAKSFPAHTLSPNASFSRNNIRLSQL